MPLGIQARGRRRMVTPREPGDLPSAVVTREDVGRGVQTLASQGAEKHIGETWVAVKCHRRDTEVQTMSSISTAARRRRSYLLASSFLVPIVSLGLSAANAQQSASPDLLPAIEVRPPPEPRRTRVEPTTERAPVSRRTVPAPTQQPPSEAK